jgi:hypothetical protein
MRGNAFIDYTQLGLSYQLYACEILFNMAICRAQNYDSLLLPAFHEDMKLAQHFLKLLQLPPYHDTHYRITACMKAKSVKQVKSFRLFQVPENVYYSPSSDLTKAIENRTTNQPGGRARVVLASPTLEPDDANYSGFSGTKLKVIFFIMALYNFNQKLGRKDGNTSGRALSYIVM